MRPQRCNLYLMSCFALNMNQAVKHTKLVAFVTFIPK